MSYRILVDENGLESEIFIPDGSDSPEDLKEHELNLLNEQIQQTGKGSLSIITEDLIKDCYFRVNGNDCGILTSNSIVTLTVKPESIIDIHSNGPVINDRDAMAKWNIIDSYGLDLIDSRCLLKSFKLVKFPAVLKIGRYF